VIDYCDDIIDTHGSMIELPVNAVLVPEPRLSSPMCARVETADTTPDQELVYFKSFVLLLRSSSLPSLRTRPSIFTLGERAEIVEYLRPLISTGTDCYECGKRKG
jgi:hypothetical protein